MLNKLKQFFCFHDFNETWIVEKDKIKIMVTTECVMCGKKIPKKYKEKINRVCNKLNE